MDGIQCWKGRGLQGVEDRKKGPRCKRWENVREKFPSCPSFACSRFYLELYNRNCSERRPKRKNSFVKLSRVDISEKLIVLLPSHAGPQVTQVLSAQRLRHETHFTKVSGIQASFQWQTRLKYSFPLEDLFIMALCFTNCQLEKQRQESVPSSWHLSSGDTTQHRGLRGATSCLYPRGAIHHSTVFCVESIIFQSDRGVLTFIHPNTIPVHNQSDWLSRKTSLFISVWKCQRYFLKNPRMLFNEWGQASIQKILPVNTSNAIAGLPAPWAAHVGLWRPEFP